MALSAVVAAAAYSVYAGQSSTSVTATSGPAAGVTDLSSKGDLGMPADRGGHPEDHSGGRAVNVRRAPAVQPAQSPAAGTQPLSPAGLLVADRAVPQAVPPPGDPAQPAPEAKPAPRGESPLDRELQRVIDGGPLADPLNDDKPVGDEPVSDDPLVDEPLSDEPIVDVPMPDEPVTDEPVTDEPVTDEPVTDQPTDEPVDEPADPIDEPADPIDEPADPIDAPADPIDVPAEPQPEDSAEPQSEPQPEQPAQPQPDLPANPAPAADPDGGLDDTAVGMLDQTDLGAAVDETDQVVSQGPDVAHPPDKPGP
jgi:hypothetical protein